MDVEPASYMRLMAAPPVVLVSTLNGTVANLAPHGMVMPVSTHPPMLALGIMEKHHTFANIMATGDFVVGLPGSDLVREINLTAEPIPADQSEFELAGLTPVTSRVVKAPRVGECQTNLECRLVWAKPAGNHMLVVGEVVAAWIRDGLESSGTRDDLDPVYHIGGRVYARRGPRIIDIG